MATPSLVDVNLEEVSFSTMNTGGQGDRKFVDILNSNGKKLQFSLCPDQADPVETRYPLNNPPQEGPEWKRDLKVILDAHPAVMAKLQALDDMVVAHAVKMSKAWFGSTLTELEVKARYKPIVFEDEKSGAKCMKFRVKCAGAPVETELHKRDAATGEIVKHGGRVEHLNKGAKVAAVLQIYNGIYFIGKNIFGVSIQAEKLIVDPGSDAGAGGIEGFSSSQPIKTVSEEEYNKRTRDDGAVAYVPYKEEEEEKQAKVPRTGSPVVKTEEGSAGNDVLVVA